jgi:protoporphyrinogen oxidase
MTTSTSADVVILGAGPAGLAAAWQARRAGADVIVVDKASEVGGMASSFEVAGVRVDHGSHRLHPSIDPAILAELRRLLGNDLQTRPRHGRVRLEGRWLEFPLRAGDLIAHLPRATALRAAFDTGRGLLRRRPARLPDDEGFAEQIRTGLGGTVADTFYLPYARKLFDLDPEELDGELARRRVGVRTAAQLVGRVLETSRGDRPIFHYPRRGYGQISEAIADAALAAGVELRLNAIASRVELKPDGGGVTVKLGDGATVTGGQLWSTVPTGALARVVAEPAVPRDVRDTAHQLGHRAMALVYVVLDRRRYTPYDAHYLPDPDHPVSRLSEPRNYRVSDDDPPTRTVLCAEVPCNLGDQHWHAKPHDLGAEVMDALAREGLPKAKPIDVVVKRLPFVYPLYRKGFAAHQAAIEDWAASLPSVVIFGRQGLFAHDNTHHALAMGWAAAACWSPQGFAWDRWHQFREGFRDHVVED